MPIKPPIFRTDRQGSVQSGKRAYERERGSAKERGYSGAWNKASKAYRATHFLCLGCQAVGLIEPSCVTDHIEPHKGDADKFWNQANWQPACRWHHDVIKQQIEALYAAGKATRVDLRLDSQKAKEFTRLLR